VRGGRGLDVEQGEVFRERLAGWQARVAAAGAAEWRSFMDATRLAAYLEDARGCL
jgi:hypothetical protein